MLAYYVPHFDTVEINSSFYRLPKTSTLEVWRDSTPERFCFAVKASRLITHLKRLKDPEDVRDKFLPVIEALGPKLGPILFQLPPNLPFSAERLSAFLDGVTGSHGRPAAGDVQAESRAGGGTK